MSTILLSLTHISHSSRERVRK